MQNAWPRHPPTVTPMGFLCVASCTHARTHRHAPGENGATKTLHHERSLSRERTAMVAT